jgi:hypothetical protein
MNAGTNDSASTGSVGEGFIPIDCRVNYRVIKPARTMNVERPVLKAKKHISSAVFWEKKV